MNNPTNIRVPTLKTGVHKIEAGNLCVSLEPARSPHKPTYHGYSDKKRVGRDFWAESSHHGTFQDGIYKSRRFAGLGTTCRLPLTQTALNRTSP